ncbi:hypothetical protein AB0M20_22650 [Actinoplanes sp. NPDC051633]|uniref:hypothetical protein n=1 Tax=Actinoplanes sp. NPDC051633 TaxID=3155670 RepID=UPI0034123EC6
MSTEIATLAASAVPFVAAAVHTYGATVLEKLQEAAADATVGVGGRILARLVGRPSPSIEAAVVDLAEDTEDEDRRAALRLQIRKALAADPELARLVADEVGSAGSSITASGERSVAADQISGVVVTGDHSHITR